MRHWPAIESSDVRVRLAVGLFTIFLWLPCRAEPKDDAAPVTAVWVSPGLWSYHFDRTAGYREGNWGAGIQADIGHEIDLMAGSFINSDRARSRYVGLMWQPVDLEFARLGVVGAAIDGYPHMLNGRWFFAAMPVVSVRYGPMGINLIFVPKVGDRLHGAVAAQFMFRVW